MRTALLIAVLAVAGTSCSDSPSSTSPGSARDAPAFAACDVTIGLHGIPDELEFERSVPWVAEDDGWYGNDALWVSLPPDGILPSVRSLDGTALETKFPWWRTRAGRPEVRTAAIGDEGQVLEGDVPSGYGDVGSPRPASCSPARAAGR